MSRPGGTPSDCAAPFESRYVEVMPDNAVVVALRKLVEERAWDQFHTPGNLAKSISIESAELLELFQWGEDFELPALKDELADVLTYCYLLADSLGLDPDDLVLRKLKKTEGKYPVDLAHGSSVKYDRLVNQRDHE